MNVGDNGWHWNRRLGFECMDDRFDSPSNVSTFNFTTLRFLSVFNDQSFHRHYCLKILSAWYLEPWEMVRTLEALPAILHGVWF